MSDELVKRLRSKIIVHTDAAVWMVEAADRIEELEAQLQYVLDRETSILRYYDAKIDEAYAKLAGAVEDFETIADTDPDGGTEWFHEFARTTIAKIKGEQP